MTSASLLIALRPLLPPEQLAEAAGLAASLRDAASLARQLVARGVLTAYQAGELCQGRGGGLVLGAYALRERLGEGGMGEVFAARHRVMQRDVALKRIHARRLGTGDAVQRFLREVRAAAKLSHPNVVQVHDAGEADGSPFLAMELLQGESLADRLARLGPLGVAEAVDFVRQACQGTQHAHDHGIVHRDVKPANLWLTPHGQVKLLDFGLARVSAGSGHTVPGTQAGTWDYMAPEQMADFHNADGRADVFSLGCTLYHLLTGTTPFHGPEMPAARPVLHLSQAVEPVERLRAGLVPPLPGIVRKMMAPKPENRYRTPGDAAAALATLSRVVATTALLPGSAPVAVLVPSSTRTSPPPPPPPPPRRSRKWPALAAGVAAVGLAVAAALLLWPGRRKPDSGPPDAAPDDGFVNGVGMRFVRVKPGRFDMGTSGHDRDEVTRRANGLRRTPRSFALGNAPADEVPEHEVELTQEFFLGAHEVTQKQWRTVIGHNPSHFCKHGEGKDVVADLDTDDFPVENVPLRDVQEFLDALAARADERPRRLRYRLPTEAEWEYACRGGHRIENKVRGRLWYHLTSSGNALDVGLANFATADEGKGGRRPLARTCKVGAYPPNVLGLYDMHGNVAEWCQDWYDSTTYRGATPRTDPVVTEEPRFGQGRVTRGGGWDTPALFCRAATRDQLSPEQRSGAVGFRVVAVPAGR